MARTQGWASSSQGGDGSVTGTLTALDSTTQIALGGRQGVSFVLTGTWVGTVSFEGSADDGSTWIALLAGGLKPVDSLYAVTTTANGTFVISNVGGLTHVRVKMSLYTSGTATVRATATTAFQAFERSVGPIGSAVPTHATAIGFSDGTNLRLPSTGAGAVGTGVQRNTLASDDPAVVALQVIDDWDEADRCKVNPIAGQVGVQGGAGATTALTQRVVLATDDVLAATVSGARVKVDPIVGQVGTAANDGVPGATVLRTVNAKRRSYSFNIGSIAMPADVGVEILGSASQTVRVKRLTLQASVDTVLTIKKNSTAHTGGTSSSPTSVPNDSANAAGTAVVKLYTVAQTGGGTLVGAVGTYKLLADQVYAIEFGEHQDNQEVVLRGAAEGLVGVLSIAATVRGSVELTEEA